MTPTTDAIADVFRRAADRLARSCGETPPPLSTLQAIDQAESDSTLKSIAFSRFRLWTGTTPEQWDRDLTPHERVLGLRDFADQLSPPAAPVADRRRA